MARARAAHLKALYTTATAPLARSDLLGHLQGESIHEKLCALLADINIRINQPPVLCLHAGFQLIMGLSLRNQEMPIPSELMYAQHQWC